MGGVNLQRSEFWHQKVTRVKAAGKFEVKLNPLKSRASGAEGISLGRMSIDKTFTGDLVASSRGEMLTAMTSEKGSAGYVAIEQVVGALSGKKGGFVLQHFGTMNQGKDHLVVEVVPGSGTDELQGLSGRLNINIESGQHCYTFEYQLE